MGSKKTPNAQRRTPNLECRKGVSEFDIRRWTFGVWRFPQSLLPAHPPEEPDPESEEEHVREPDEKLGVELGIRAEGVRDDDEEEIEDADDEAGGEAEGGFAAVRRDPKRNADQGEDETRHRKRKALVDLGATGAAHLWVVVL